MLAANANAAGSLDSPDKAIRCLLSPCLHRCKISDSLCMRTASLTEDLQVPESPHPTMSRASRIKERDVHQSEGPCCMKVVARTWDWLAEQPEDAAELAVLLYEAAPKLNIAASSTAGGSAGAGHHAAKTPRRAHHSEDGGLLERLAAAVPMPIGQQRLHPCLVLC